MSIDLRKLAKKMQKAQKEHEEEKEQEQRQQQIPEEITVKGNVNTEGTVQMEAPDEVPAGTAPQQTQRAAPIEDEADDVDDLEQDEEASKVALEPSFEDSGSWTDTDDEPRDEDLSKDEKRQVDQQYALIPNDPGPNERVFASAHIYYDEASDELVYEVSEPELTAAMENVLDDVEELLKQQIDVDFGQMKEEEAREYLQGSVREILDSHGFGLSQEQREVIQYYAYRNFVGLERLEPVMEDTNIEDISCDGTNVPIYVYHRDADIGSVKTNVVFEDDDELDAFVRKLAQRCGRSISMASPLLDGSLPDGSRVQATLGTDIARRGTNFTIRRFTDEPLTPVHLMEYGTVNAEMFAYLWMAVENGLSVLVAGATAAGKTTLLNALSLFIRPELKIVSIEDTPELRLPHPNWVPEVAREGFGFGEQDTGQVTLDDLLKESLRQRPDYIIVGEVRGEEAYILFQQIATGHPGMATIHASSMEKIMDRLTTKPIDLPPSLIENLDLLLFAKRTRRKGSYIRRVDSIFEFIRYDKDKGRPVVNKVFDWQSRDDTFKTNRSTILSEIAESQGRSVQEVQEEVVRRKRVLKWMQQQGIKHYEDVGRIISTYYHHPDRILERVEAEL